MESRLDRWRELAPLSVAPLAMRVGGLFFVFYGAPHYSLDAWRRARERRHRFDG